MDLFPSFRRSALTLALLCCGSAQATDLAAVIVDNQDVSDSIFQRDPWGQKTRHSNWRIVYLDCTLPATCTERTAPGATGAHATTVADIVMTTTALAAGVARPMVLYSARGGTSPTALLNWLAEDTDPSPTSTVSRARARGIKVYVNTLGVPVADGTGCTADPTRAALAAQGLLFLHAAGNHGRNGICDSRFAALQCDANTFNVAGTGSGRTAEACFEKTEQTDPLWPKSNFLPGHTPYAAPIDPASWAAGGVDRGTSFSAPGVAGGALGLAAKRQHPRVDFQGGVLDLRAAIEATAASDTYLNQPVRVIDRATLASAAQGFCDASVAVPENGFYFDPDHPGTGMHVLVRAPGAGPERDMHVVWYTYRNDGTPVWYYASGTYDAALRNFSGGRVNLIEYRWVESSDPAVPPHKEGTNAGTLMLDVCKPWSMNFRWTLKNPNRNGVESIKRFHFNQGGPVRPAFAPTMSGLWYDAAIDGAGYSIESQGNADFVAYYHYADDGRAVWSQAQFQYTQNQAAYTAQFDTFASLSRCPACGNGEGGTATAAGAEGWLTFRFSPQLRIEPTMSTGSPLPIHWPRANSPASGVPTLLLK